MLDRKLSDRPQEADMHFFDLEQRAPKEVAPGVHIRTHWADKMLMSVVDLDPDAVVPNHQHPHEQAGVMLTGEMTLTIQEEVRLLRPGDSYLIPGGVEHSARAGVGGARVIDIFSPVREEYKY
jgi:quercetin dioxygenase-like cupin family protein